MHWKCQGICGLIGQIAKVLYHWRPTRPKLLRPRNLRRSIPGCLSSPYLSACLMAFCWGVFAKPTLYPPFLLYSDISKCWFCLISAKIPDCGKISGIGRSWIFGRGVSWVQIICARLTLSRPPHTPRLTGGAGHQLDGIRLHFSSKSQPIRGCFYAADNLAIGCKWKDGANALAPVRTAPKHQRLFSEKTLRKT